MSESVPLPFDDLRRLTGPNLYFAGPGAVLETLVGAPVPSALIEDWKRRIARARAALGWPDGPVTVREHASGASLAFAAPGDMLYTDRASFSRNAGAVGRSAACLSIKRGNVVCMT